jgi:hypothetical protein
MCFWAPLSFRDPRAFLKAEEERTSTCASSSSSSSSSWMSRHALAMALDRERLAPRSPGTKRAEI